MSFDPNAAATADSGIFGLTVPAEQSAVVLVPIPFDATTSYRPGTALGPQAILEASRQVDLYDVNFGRPYRGGIHLLPLSPEVQRWNREARHLAVPVIAAGGVGLSPSLREAAGRVDIYGAEVNTWVEEQVETWLDKGKIVGCVGGDHSTPFGAIKVLSERYPELGVLHIDAHADLRDAYEGFKWSHASIMYNVLHQLPGVARLVQVGIRDVGEDEVALIQGEKGRVTTFFDTEFAHRQFAGVHWADMVAQILRNLPDKVYVSFDIDGLDPALCPHTGTPVPGGLSFHQAEFLLGELARSGRTIVGFDLNEVAPGPEGDEWDANVGARVLYKLIGATLRSRQA